MTLLACTWPDQLERIRMLQAAIAIARGMSCRIDAAGAADWLHSRLATPVTGGATVVLHSKVRTHLSESERARVTSLTEQAGPAATPKTEPRRKVQRLA